MSGHKAFALLMGMRTGKTKVTLDDFGQLEVEDRAKDLLIIAPGGVYETWLTAIDEHVGPNLRPRLRTHKWISGANKTQRKYRERFLALEDDRPRALVMNIEALSAVKEARETALAFLRPRAALTDVAVDESTTIKNPASKCAKFVCDEIGNLAEYRRILTGLPTPKDPLDIYQQFYFLDWKILGHRSYYSFRARYANLFGIDVRGANGKQRHVQLVKGFKDVDEIHAKIEPYSFRRRLEDCYDVPEKEYLPREVTMTDKQLRIYKEMLQFATAQLSDTSFVSANIVIAQMTKLHQILCGHVVDEQGVEHEIPENLTPTVVEILEEYDGKAVVWCSYDNDIQKVARALEKAFGEGSTARFWGGNKSTREAEEKRFQDDPKCRFMVATASAGGRGRMWAVANLVIYYSNTDNLEHRSQSEERPQAVGKRDAVTYIDLVVRNTVADRFLYAIRNKMNLSDIITGDNWKQWVV